MKTTARPAEVLLFRCSHCQTELSVPSALQGVVGPCPCCGEQTQAPLAAACLHLPPLDGAPEASTTPIEQPHWMDASPLYPSVAAPVKNGERLTPRQLSDHGSLGFSAKHSIPQSEVPLDNSWREKHLEDRRRKQSIQKIERATDEFLESRVWKIARTGLMIATGGLCAGLAIYLQDRNWVLDLPWRPGPVETIVKVPTAAAARSRALEAVPPDPFLVEEDPADLEVVSRRPVLLPVPEVQSLPVSATPIAAGEK